MTHPIGPDYASVDQNAPPDFAAAKAAGARFAIPRAIYGRPLSGSRAPFRDPVWARDRDRILAAGLQRSAYLFLCFEKRGVYTPTPEEQAQAFIDYVQLEVNKDFVPMVDVEETTIAMTADQMYEWTVRCVKRFREHYGTWPGIYTSARVWSENLRSHSPGPLLNCPLWLAKPWPWAVRTPVHLDGAPTYTPKLIPEWGNQWFFYQYQGDAIRWPGFSKTVDANRFRVFGEGAKGNHVVWMQERLKIAADGIFGPATKAAVQELQRKHGLAADGIVGPLTFAPLCWQNPE